MPPPIFRKQVQEAPNALDDLLGASAPVAPNGTLPPEYYSGAPNAGLTSGFNVQALPPPPLNPVQVIAQALIKAQQMKTRQ